MFSSLCRLFVHVVFDNATTIQLAEHGWFESKFAYIWNAHVHFVQPTKWTLPPLWLRMQWSVNAADDSNRISANLMWARSLAIEHMWTHCVQVRVNLLNNSIVYPSSSGGVAAYQPSVPPPPLHGVAGAASAANPAMALLMQQQRQSLAALQAVSAVFNHQAATAPVAATAAQINYANTVQTPHGLLPIYRECALRWVM
jgi:hypothetical protein